MDTKRVESLMASIVDCGVCYTMPEFQLALTLALAAYIVEMHSDDIERMLELHVSNVRACAHQMDSKGGETDLSKLLDLNGFEL
jgi:hypothetical protein